MNQFKEIRQSKSMSQWSLAQRSKVHQSRISLAENGLIELNEDERRRLAEALGVTVSEIFGKEKTSVGSKKNGGAPESFSMGK